MFQVTRLFKLITNYATQKFVTDIGSRYVDYIEDGKPLKTDLL